MFTSLNTLYFCNKSPYANGCGFSLSSRNEVHDDQYSKKHLESKAELCGIQSQFVKTIIGVRLTMASGIYFTLQFSVSPPKRHFRVSSLPGSKYGSLHNSMRQFTASCKGN